MQQKISTSFTLFVFILLMIVGLWALTNYYAELPQHTSQHETIILGQNRYEVIPALVVSSRSSMVKSSVGRDIDGHMFTARLRLARPL